MSVDRKTEIRVGAVTILGLVLLVVGLSFGRGCSIGVNRPLLLFRFERSGGVDANSPVLVNGVKRGAVTSVRNENGGVIIEAAIDDIADLRSDVSARITMLEITGGKKIDIYPGNAPTRLAPGTVIAGTVAADATELVALLGEFSDDARILLKRLDTLTGLASTFLKDGKTLDQLVSTLDNLDKLVVSVSGVVDRNQGKIDQTFAELPLLLQDLRGAVERNEPGLRTLVARLDSLAVDAKATLASTKAPIANADQVMVEAKNLLRDIRQSDGLAAKLIYDQTFFLKLDSTLFRVNSFVQQVGTHGINTNIRLGTRP